MDSIQTAAKENSTLLCISAVKQASSGMIEITSSDGPVFFIRTEYLSFTSPERIEPGTVLNAQETDDVIDAGFAFLAERKAEEYLAVCEQCRSGLERKLIAKKYDRTAVSRALDYLESRKFLDDSRFCRIWLRSRIASKPQGRSRLFAELTARGIKGSVARSAIEEFFYDCNEKEICIRAYRRAVKNRKSDEKLIKFLMDSGFQYGMIRDVIEEFSSETDCIN